MATFAYADPPYPGMANLYPERTEVDHPALIADLVARFDGWALWLGEARTPARRRMTSLGLEP